MGSADTFLSQDSGGGLGTLTGLSSNPTPPAAAPVLQTPRDQPPKPKRATKSSKAKTTLDFLTAGMEVKHSSNHKSVFGSFDDSEGDDDDEEGDDTGSLFGKSPTASARGAGHVFPPPTPVDPPAPLSVAPTPPLAPSVPSPAPAPAPSPAPTPIPAPAAPATPPALSTDRKDMAVTLARSAKILSTYLQDEGAGAPRPVWEALEAIEKVGKCLE